MADLKTDKDRNTPDIFVASVSTLLHSFCRGIERYANDECGDYAAVFPALTQEHLDQLHQEICSVHTTLDDLFNTIERKSKQ